MRIVSVHLVSDIVVEVNIKCEIRINKITN